MDVWVIKYGLFETRIDVNEIGLLSIPQVRKLLKLSRTADNPGSLESFGPLLDKARDKAISRLVKVVKYPLADVMGWDEIPQWCSTEKEQNALRRSLVKDQKQVCDRLDKIKSIYVKEFMNYEY